MFRGHRESNGIKAYAAIQILLDDLAQGAFAISTMQEESRPLGSP
jgi:hypothetical protein